MRSPARSRTCGRVQQDQEGPEQGGVDVPGQQRSHRYVASHGSLDRFEPHDHRIHKGPEHEKRATHPECPAEWASCKTRRHMESPPHHTTRMIMMRAVATRGSRSRTSFYASTTTFEDGRAWQPRMIPAALSCGSSASSTSILTSPEISGTAHSPQLPTRQE